MSLLNIEESVLTIIDIQEKLVYAVRETPITDKAKKLVKAANILQIPTIISEQYPKGLGSTVSEIKLALPDDTKYIEKTAFSLMQESDFTQYLKTLKKKQVILCGIEAHICVYQTAQELSEAGYEVIIVKDACASRNTYDYETAINTMQKDINIKILSLEMVLFEWLRSSKHPKFKEIQSLIK